MNTQLTLDGREVAHPPRGRRKVRTYVVSQVVGRDAVIVLGLYDADRPSTAARRAKHEHRLDGVGVLAVASRYWKTYGS